MKISFATVVVVGIVIGHGGCISNEETFPSTPFIESSSVTFIDQRDLGKPDTLKLTIDFIDGDFDLGLSPNNLDDHRYPYHAYTYFIHSPSGLEKIIPEIIEFDDYESLEFLDSNQDAKIVTFKSINEKDPDTAPPLSCRDYHNTELMVANHLIDNSSSIIESFENDISLVRDTFLRKPNEDHYNIKVEFMVENNGNYELFDWSEYCTSFDGRFPLISQAKVGSYIKNGPFYFIRTTKSKGRLIYSMASIGFQVFLQGKKLKLRVSIMDRALNKSNTLETDPIVIQ